MLGSKPVTVSRVPHLSAKARFESFTVTGYGRECFTRPNRRMFTYDREENRRANYYDNKNEYNTNLLTSPLTLGEMWIQHRANTSGWFSFGQFGEGNRRLFFSYRHDAKVQATYRDAEGTLCVFEGTISDLFYS